MCLPSTRTRLQTKMSGHPRYRATAFAPSVLSERTALKQHGVNLSSLAIGRICRTWGVEPILHFTEAAQFYTELTHESIRQPIQGPSEVNFVVIGLGPSRSLTISAPMTVT